VPGPAPKDPAQRRRRNEPTRGEWVDLPPLEERVLPELPKTFRGRMRWSPRTRAAWDAWAQDPATGQYTAADIAACVELAYLMEGMVRGEEKPSEVRLRMDGLGLTAKGKRDLRWRPPAYLDAVPDTDDSETAPAPLAQVRPLRAV
jgi:hypothetical protein